MSRKKGSRLAAAERTGAELRELVPWVRPRQVEYWVAKGYVTPDRAVQGHPRSFSAAELRVLAVLARLTRAGMRARLAAQVARTAAGQLDRVNRHGAYTDTARVDLGDGIVIEIGGV